MKFIFVPDSFKGTLSSQEVIEILDKQAKKVFNNVETLGIPIADGGEGTIDVVKQICDGKKYYVKVQNPIGEVINAYYLKLKNNKVLIEMSIASGITLIPYHEGNALITSSYGTGELIKSALDSGAKDIIISVGGSATNDGGIGMLSALGVNFYNKENEKLFPIGKNLSEIEKIDITNIDKRIFKTKFTVMCDVVNPLLGQNGATYTFGSQKGANKDQLILLEKGMKNYAGKIKNVFNVDVSQIEGGGAAGGIGAALFVFCNAKIKSGIETILDLINFDSLIEDADLIITGEGKIDIQSANGKVLNGIGRHAKQKNIPVIAICGGMDKGASKIYSCGVDSIMVTPNKAMRLEEALQEAHTLMEDATERMFKMIKIGMNLKIN